MKHGKNFTLGEYVIIKKPDLMTIGDNVRISDFCRISSACDIGSDCEIAPGTYIAGGDGKYTFKMGECSSLAAGVKVWLSSNDYVNELVTHSVPEVKEIQATSRWENTPASEPIRSLCRTTTFRKASASALSVLCRPTTNSSPGLFMPDARYAPSKNATKKMF